MMSNASVNSVACFELGEFEMSRRYLEIGKSLCPDDSKLHQSFDRMLRKCSLELQGSSTFNEMFVSDVTSSGVLGSRILRR